MIPFVCTAPMAGITDKPFRTMLRSFGKQPLYTEMIGAGTLFHNHPQTRKMLYISDEKNIIVQLVGIDEEQLVYAAKQAVFYGAVGVNLNMGCPVKKLITNGSGAALMKTPDRAARIVEAVKKAVDVPVGVKTRIGWDSTHINIMDFAQKIQSAGADSLIVHGRTKEQGYAGTADWNIIGQVKKSLSIPVIANGDIACRQTALSAARETLADGLMIGRALLGKPWLLSQIETGCLSPVCLTDIVLKHLDLMLSYYGTHGLLVARKHLAWYARGKKGVAQFCQNVYAEEQIDKVQKMIHDFFDSSENES